MIAQVRGAAAALLLLAILTGVVYPGIVTGIARFAFPRQAEGSLVERSGVAAGSELIGQWFSEPKYFWGRLSATTPFPYTAFDASAGTSGTGSNLGPSNPALVEAVKARMDALKAADANNVLAIPVDLVTASGSGLDPDIGPAAAEYQAGRVARVRGMDVGQIRRMIGEYTRGRTLGIFGEPRVNVLELNLALDSMAGAGNLHR